MFVDRDGERHEIKGKVGDNVLYLAHRYGIEMEGSFLSLSLSLSLSSLLVTNLHSSYIPMYLLPFSHHTHVPAHTHTHTHTHMYPHRSM